MNGLTKLIRISTENEISIHPYPEGDCKSVRHHLVKLIGNNCGMCERVRPKRLYNNLQCDVVENSPAGVGVLMLVDEEGLCKGNAKVNSIASWLYETDKHGSPIVGNVLIIGEAYKSAGIDFTGLHAETAMELQEKLIVIARKANRVGGII